MSVTRDLSIDWGITGLAGTLAYRVLAPDGSTLIARTTTGVAESPAGSGMYHVQVATWDPAWVGRVVWDAGGSGVGAFAEESFDAMSAGGSAAGPGADAVEVAVTADGDPVPDADVWVTSDADGQTTVAGTLQTDSGGAATFLLDAGQTYYFWLQKDGYNAIAGEAFEAAASVAFETTAAEPATTADGYYAKRAKVIQIAGRDNFGLQFNLDNDATVADEAVAQDTFDRADRYVDSRARVLGVPADAGAESPHVIHTDNAQFGRISDLASEIARVYGYLLRGTVGGEDGDQSKAADGQMAKMRARAEAELDEILRSLVRAGGLTDGLSVVRDCSLPAAGCDGMCVI